MKSITLIGKIALALGASLLTMQLAQAATFQIQGVASWDSLNMRIKPGVKNKVITKIPYNGKNIRLTGQRVSVGRTVWTQINWQGKTGWVSEQYIRPTKSIPKAAPKPITRTTAAPGSKGKWVLECGNMSPFWKVVVHPKALDVNHRGQAAGMIPITYEKQDRNRWNTAMKTVLKSSNGQIQADLTIKYTKQCFHTLSKQNVHYRVKAMIRGEEMQGCCRAIRIQ